MRIIELHRLDIAQTVCVFELWNNEYPLSLAYNDIHALEEYLSKLLSLRHYLLVDNNNAIYGWAFDFMREEEKWFAVILDTHLHGQGYGSMLLNRLKSKNQLLNGWVIDHNKELKWNGQKYRSPLDFYLKNGFRAIPEKRLETDKISAVKIVWANETGD